MCKGAALSIQWLVTLGPRPIEPLCCKLGQWLWKLLAATLLTIRVVLLARGWVLGVALFLTTVG